MIVKKTFRLSKVFLLQPLMPPSLFRNIIMTSGTNELNKDIPGKVYLCQVNRTVSCGACCGLYNVEDASREALQSRLMARTDKFTRVPRTVDAILEFKAEIEFKEDESRPFPKFHHCPYIGLAGTNRSRVGCLLHPLADGNQGIDFRGLSYYGGMACRVYFCPTYREVSGKVKKLILGVASDWYLYGLVITEVSMLQAFSDQLQNRTGRSLTVETLLKDETCRQHIKAFLNLKLNWPFRTTLNLHPANYFFEDELYRNAPISYEAIGTPPSQYDAILRSLNTHIESKETLDRAEEVLERLFTKIARALSI